MVTSLQAAVDPVADLVSRLRLDHAARARGVVVVEGPSDRDVYARAFGIDKRRIFAAAGRVNVLRVARTLTDRPLRGVTCVADRDFDDAASEFSDSEFVVFSDNADMDMMLFACSVLDRVVEAWGTRAKLKKAGGPASLRTRVVRCVAPLSSLRAANVLERWGLAFKDLSVVDLVDRDCLELNVRSVAAKLANASVSRRELEARSAADFPICPATGMPLTSGRDAASATDAALRKLVGNLSHQQVKDGVVARSLRLAVGRGDLSGSGFAERFESALAAAEEAGQQSTAQSTGRANSDEAPR